MGSRLTSHLAGLAIPIDPDRLLDDIAANTGAATTSSYTQAGSRPGASVPESSATRLVPVVSGGLGQDIEIVTVRSGTPTLAEDACELGYRLADEADSKIRGWTAPNWITGAWHVLTGGPSPDCPGDIATLPGTQKVIALLAYSSKVYVRTYDTGAVPETVWSAAVEVHDGLVYAAAILVLPTGRILVFVSGTVKGTVYRSDDDGATWALHAENTLYSAQTNRQLRMAYSHGQICIIDQSSTTLRQYASTDELGSIEKIGSDSSNSNGSAGVVAHPNGSFIVGYQCDSTLDPCVRILPNAYAIFDDMTEVVLDTANCIRVCLVADPDGLLWMYVADATDYGMVALWFSFDGGGTWTEMLYGATDHSDGATDYLKGLAGTHAAGSVFILANPVGSTSGADETLAIRFGGWETVSTRSPGNNALLSYRGGTGGETGSNNGWMYVPFELPGDTGKWTRTAAGSPTESLTNEGLVLGTVTGGTDAIAYTISTTTATTVTLEFGIRVDAGGSSSADEIIASINTADNTNDFLMKIRFFTSGGTTWINTRDVNDASPDKGSDDTGIASGTAVRVRMHILEGATVASATGYVWFAATNDPEWTLAWSGALTNDTATPAATGQLRWGLPTTPATTAAETVWAYVVGAGGAGHLGASLTTATVKGVAGRPLTNLPVPLHPELEDSNGLVPWLAVAAGPGALGEVVAVDRDFDYPIEHVLPTVSPSPDERWRSTSTAEQILAWDAGDESWVGDSVALVASGCNFREAVLSYYNGAAWVDVGTLDLATGFTTLDYSLSGDALIPGASTTSGARYIQEGELAGGYVKLETGGGGGTASYRIRWNTAGSWVSSSGATTPLVRVLLDGDLSSVDSTGQCDIVWPSGVLVVHAAAIVRARRWRWKITASQVIPDTYYTAGCLVPMAVRAFGAAPDWGWSRERLPNAETRTSRYGTTRTRKLGPPIDVWAMGWTSGTDWYDIRNTASPSYVGSSVGMPLTVGEDVAPLLNGLLLLSESGEVPVCALAKIPDASGTTITDPTLYLLGRLSSSIRWENESGDENSNEVIRVAQIEVRKLV
jgi:hypothetical protein